MKTRVFVDGQEGTTGLRIHEMLARRSDCGGAAHRRRQAARTTPNARRLLNEADVAFLCLPDADAREAAALGEQPEHLPDRRQHRPPHGARLGVGLPELAPDQRQKLRAGKRIANPGCHASAFILLLRPLVDAGLVAPDLPVSATSITGYSGGGKKMIEQYQAGGDARLDSPRPYALALAHKHVPEMMAHTGLRRSRCSCPW